MKTGIGISMQDMVLDAVTAITIGSAMSLLLINFQPESDLSLIIGTFLVTATVFTTLLWRGKICTDAVYFIKYVSCAVAAGASFLYVADNYGTRDIQAWACGFFAGLLVLAALYRHDLKKAKTKAVT